MDNKTKLVTLANSSLCFPYQREVKLLSSRLESGNPEQQKAILLAFYPTGSVIPVGSIITAQSRNLYHTQGESKNKKDYT